MTAIPDDEPVPSNFEEIKSKFASSVCVRLLTDPTSNNKNNKNIANNENKDVDVDSTKRPTTRPTIRPSETPEIRNCRGMAFVDFSTNDDQLKCIKLLNKSGFNGRIINVERCDKKKPSNGNGGNGGGNGNGKRKFDHQSNSNEQKSKKSV